MIRWTRKEERRSFALFSRSDDSSAFRISTVEQQLQLTWVSRALHRLYFSLSLENRKSFNSLSNYWTSKKLKNVPCSSLPLAMPPEAAAAVEKGSSKVGMSKFLCRSQIFFFQCAPPSETMAIAKESVCLVLFKNKERKEKRKKGGSRIESE